MVSGPTSIYLCYRASEDDPAVHDLTSFLKQHFGFSAVTEVETGEDRELPSHVLAGDGLVIMVFGMQWLRSEEQHGRRTAPSLRFFKWLSAAVEGRAKVLPILLDGTRMLSRADLPPSVGLMADALTHASTIRGWPTSREALVAQLESLGGRRLKQTRKSKQATRPANTSSAAGSPPPAAAAETVAAQKRGPRSPLVYISYVSDTEAVAERLAQHLVDEFGPDQVFFFRHLQIGERWQASLMQRLAESTACVVLISNLWERRVRTEGAAVREELATVAAAAVNEQIALLPLLVDGTRMPTSLPPELLPIGSFYASPLRSGSQWDEDVGRLVTRLQQLGFVPKAQPTSASAAPLPPLDPAAATDLCTLAFQLVLDHKAPPELLRHFEPEPMQRALHQLETDSRRPSHAGWQERLRSAMEQLGKRQAGHEPNALWLAWMLETQSFRLQRLQHAMTTTGGAPGSAAEPTPVA